MWQTEVTTASCVSCTIYHILCITNVSSIPTTCHTFFMWHGCAAPQSVYLNYPPLDNPFDHTDLFIRFGFPFHLTASIFAQHSANVFGNTMCKRKYYFSVSRRLKYLYVIRITTQPIANIKTTETRHAHIQVVHTWTNRRNANNMFGDFVSF